MSNINDRAAKCGRCAFCVAGCPVFAVTLRQGLGPRSKTFIFERIQSGEANISPDLADAFYLCTHCGQCAVTCPSGVPVPDLVMKGRRLAARQNLAPSGLSTAIRAINSENNPFAEPRSKRTDLWPEDTPGLDNGGTLFWAGCMAAYQDLKVIPSAVGILNAAGETIVSLGQGEGCCGYLAWLAGDEAAFIDIARKNQTALAAPDRIVTTCAGCLMTLGRLYQEYGLTIAPTVHFTVWLAERIADQTMTFKETAKPVRVIYHDPCDLGRHSGIYDPPRRILQALPGVQLLEFAANRESAECCGGGGGIKAVDLELSLIMAENRVKQAAEQNADIIASACPSCKQNLNQAVSRLKKKGLLARRIKVMDISEIVATRLK